MRLLILLALVVAAVWWLQPKPTIGNALIGLRAENASSKARLNAMRKTLAKWDDYIEGANEHAD